MRIASLVFDPAPRTPMLHGVGIALAVTPGPALGALPRFEISCRLPSSKVPDGRLEVPAAIFLTAVHAVSQRPVLTNLVGDRILFEDDATLASGYVVVVARGELDAREGPIGPYFLQASCFELVSNVIHVG